MQGRGASSAGSTGAGEWTVIQPPPEQSPGNDSRGPLTTDPEDLHPPEKAPRSALGKGSVPCIRLQGEPF